MFLKFSKSHKPFFHKYLLIKNCTRRPCDFLSIVYSTKLWSTNQNSKIYSSSVFPSESFETCRANVRNLRKTSVEPGKTSKFFESSLEIFGTTSEVFGPTWEIFGRLLETSEIFGSTSDVFGRLRLTLESLGNLRVNFGKKSNWYSWEYNLGLILLLSSNQNPVKLLLFIFLFFGGGGSLSISPFKRCFIVPSH